MEKIEKNDSGRKVKGAFIIPLAMMINRKKYVDWVNLGGLSSEDLNLIQAHILASNWYDLDFFIRLSTTVFRLVWNNSSEEARRYAKGALWDTLAKIYQFNLLRNNPKSALVRFATLYNVIFFNTGTADFELETERVAGQECRAVFRIVDPAGIPVPEFFIPVLQGLLEKILCENNGEQVVVRTEVSTEFLGKKVYSVTYQLRWKEDQTCIKKAPEAHLFYSEINP